MCLWCSTAAANKRKILQWSLGSVALVTTCGRYYLRWRHSHKARLDDLFNGLALFCLLTYFAVCQAKWSTSDPAAALRLWLAQNLLFWTCLYFVKATFLALFWFIFNVSAAFRKAWWTVTVFNFISFWAIFLSQLWQCGNPLVYADPQSCETYFNRPLGVLPPWQIAAYVLAFILHIPSDCLLIALPIFFLRKLQMSRSRKFSVATVLAIGVFDTVLGLTRLITLLCGQLNWPGPTDVARDMIFIDVAGILEPAVAVIVCALPIYRLLLPACQRNGEEETELQRNAARMGTVTTVEASKPCRSLV